MKKSIIKLKSHQKLLINLLTFAAIAGIWQIIALVVNNRVYLPTIDLVFDDIKILMSNKDFFRNFSVTVLRTLHSYAITITIVTLIVAVLIRSNVIYEYFRPVNSIIISLPPMIVVVLIMIWTTKTNVPIVLGSIIAFPLIFEQIYTAMRDAKDRTTRLVSVYNIPFKKQFLKIYLPTITFTVISTFTSMFLITFKMVIAGEIFAYPEYGIGAVIQFERIVFDIPMIYSWLVVISLFTYFLIVLQGMVNNWIMRWKHE